MSGTALVLAGHGSHISPHTAGVVWSYVDRLRNWGVADEITACFWKEPPAFSQVLDTLLSRRVVVVPVFTARGYFTQDVLPAEMGLSGRVTERNGMTITLARPLGEHSSMTRIVRNTVRDTLGRYDLKPEETAVAIIGHGTKRNPNSREATRRQAQKLRRWNGVNQVVDVYLDDDPQIASIYETTTTLNIIAVPFFLAAGSHVSIDLPRELGIAADDRPASVCGRQVYYADPLGADESVCEAILELALEAGIRAGGDARAGSWPAFPRSGRQTLENELETGKILRFGQVMASGERVWHRDNDRNSIALSSAQALRRFVREAPFRPLPTSTDLPAGWHVEGLRSWEVHAVLETVYPGLLADWAAARAGKLQIEPLEVTAARQLGMFRDVHRLDEASIDMTVEQVCGSCIRQPTWWKRQSGGRFALPRRLQHVAFGSGQVGRSIGMSIGKVYLVGAGPGDPDLITRKALRLLREADVVIYDRLIPTELLDEVRPDAELIDAGKQPQKQRLSQADITATLIDRAAKGKQVLRLKGGDPLLFGRGGEEALACHENGIEFDIVPGVSSAYAAPAYAGIPLTHRGLSSSLTVITGHEDPTQAEGSINYKALAEIGGTIVILMGVKQLPRITRQLLEHGLAGDTPAATIEWGALPRQRTLVGTLATIAGAAAEYRIQPPAITVIGEVVRLREAGMQWFDLPRADAALPHQEFAGSHAFDNRSFTKQ